MKSVMKKYKHKFEMVRLLLKKENPTIVEIGSHYGEDSLRFLETFPECTIYCFEPDPRNIKIFNKHIKDRRVKLFELALSSQKGIANFYQSYQPSTSVPEKYDWISEADYEELMLNNSGSSSLKRGYKHNLNQTIQVNTERYDNWCEEHHINNVDFVWVDVQGAEKSVLEGMGEKIKNIKFIWIEYGEIEYEGAINRQETISHMHNRSFNVIEEYSNQSLTGDLLFYNNTMETNG